MDIEKMSNIALLNKTDIEKIKLLVLVSETNLTNKDKIFMNSFYKHNSSKTAADGKE